MFRAVVSDAAGSVAERGSIYRDSFAAVTDERREIIRRFCGQPANDRQDKLV